MDLDAEVPVQAARHLLALVQEAEQASRRGDAGAAERLCLDVLELHPTQGDALRLLYELRKAAGQWKAAEVLLRRLVRLDPNDLACTVELALVLMQKGNMSEAELHARNAVRIAPESAQAHNVLAMVLTESHRPGPGAHHYRRALDLSSRRDPILLANLGWNCKLQGRIAEARALYQESVAAAPGVLNTLLGWARLEEVDRNFGPAGDLLDRAAEIAPDNPSVILARAVLLGRERRYEQALKQLEMLAETTANGELGPTELLEKGRLLDRMGHYDQAWANFEEAKRRGREMGGCLYLADAATSLAGRLRSFFIAQRLRLLPRAAARTDVAQPIFILGFPRSGTTLVEQTLSAHARIAAGDELPFIHEIANVLPRMLESPLTYPEALAELWMGDRKDGLDNLRDYYLQKVRQSGVVASGAVWFTDKMPLNETHLGLIGLLFPLSPMIHLIRHPLDVVVSVFSNQLSHGFFCASALESIARHYVLVADLVEHYRAEMPLRYLPVRYEDIVSDQAATVRRMFEFVGETFDERCLNFHENRRYARTASYAQVAEALYGRSVFRYKNYRRQLEPVLPILRPVIERLGYAVD